MTICPIAIVVGCQKCPAYQVCPLKGIIGDHNETAQTPDDPPRGQSGPTKNSFD